MVVPESVPKSDDNVKVTLESSVVMILPLVSVTSTVTAGVMVLPVVVPVGCCAKANVDAVAVPPVMVNDPEENGVVGKSSEGSAPSAFNWQTMK